MRPIDLTSFLDYRYISDPRWSSNGQWISYTVLTPDIQSDCYQKRIHVIDRGGREAPGSPLEGVSGAVWTTEGETLLLLRALPEENAELLCFDPKNGTSRPCAQLPCMPQKMEPVDKNQLLLTVSTSVKQCEHLEENYSVYTEVPLRLNGGAVNEGRRTHLYLFDVETGTMTPLFCPEDATVSLTAVSGNQLLFAALPCTGVPCDTAGLYRADLETRQVEELFPAGEWYIRALGFLEKEPVFSGSKGEVYGRYQYDGFYGLQSGRPMLLQAFDACVGLNSILSDNLIGNGQMICSRKEGVYFITTVNDESYVCLLSPDGTISARLTAACAVTGFDVWNGQIVYCGAKGCALAELYLEEGERQLTQHNELARTYALSHPVPLTAKSPDGACVSGWVMSPPVFHDGERYPAILSIHGGPRSSYSALAGNEFQMLAAKGYFILYCNPRGSDSRGNEFGDIRGGYGGVDQQDVLAFLDQALRDYPKIDPERVGILGGSYGGYLVNWMVGHTDRFRAAVSVRSISNWITHECLSDIGHYYVKDQAGASLLDEDGPAKLWNNSPLKYVGNVTTPTLFIHADQDFRCCMQEPMQMFYALKMRGVPTRFALFHGENHGMQTSGRPRSRIGSMRETLAWFDQYLKGLSDGAEQLDNSK